MPSEAVLQCQLCRLACPARQHQLAAQKELKSIEALTVHSSFACSLPTSIRLNPSVPLQMTTAQPSAIVSATAMSRTRTVRFVADAHPSQTVRVVELRRQWARIVRYADVVTRLSVAVELARADERAELADGLGLALAVAVADRADEVAELQCQNGR